MRMERPEVSLVSLTWLLKHRETEQLVGLFSKYVLLPCPGPAEQPVDYHCMSLSAQSNTPTVSRSREAGRKNLRDRTPCMRSQPWIA